MLPPVDAVHETEQKDGDFSVRRLWSRSRHQALGGRGTRCRGI